MTTKTETKLKSPVELAFVGDAVYELLVRDYIARRIDTNAHTLHRMAVEYVCAEAQSQALDKISDLLSDEEKDIARRGKNANKTAVPRNGNPKSYRNATALEALFGYLHLCGEKSRIEELFSWIVDHEEADKDELK